MSQQYRPGFGSAWQGFQSIEEQPRCERCQGQAELLVTHIHRRDWGQIIRALEGSGVSIKEIARRVQRADTTVLHWINGGEPKESDARKVLALYRRHIGEIA